MRTTNFFNLTTSASGLPASGDFSGQTFIDLSGGQGNKGSALVWREEEWDGYKWWAAGWYGPNGAPWTPKAVGETFAYATAKVDGDYVARYFSTDNYILWFVFRYEASTEYDITIGANQATVSYYIYVEDENYDSPNNAIASGQVFGKGVGSNETESSISFDATDRMLCWVKVVTSADDVGESPEATLNVQHALGGP